MNDLPLPLPDRRINKNKNNTSLSFNEKNKIKLESKNNNNISRNNNDLKNEELIESTNSSIKATSLIKLKQVEDMRQKILNYKLSSEKSIFLTINNNTNNTYINNNNTISSLNNNNFIEKCNIILFGPSGSGKSSFIKSLYRSLYNSAILPPDIISKLIIKGKYHNEGTINFTKFYLVESDKKLKKSGIILYDTRGHRRMDDKESEQFKIMIEGNIKDGVNVEQKKNREAKLFWEFWKKDSELFPDNIFIKDKNNNDINNIPHSIVFIFDGSTDEVIQSEDINFYKNLINYCNSKGYKDIHIILTRIDIFEKKIKQRFNNLEKIEKNAKLNLLKDQKIEKVIEILGINRSNIHFIENYHDNNDNDIDDDDNENNIFFITKKNNLEIDYHILKTLLDIINSSELFISDYNTLKQSCLAGCFF